jgi:Recombinase zinc beta ribbon domain
LTDEAIWQAAQQPPVARQPPGTHTALLGGLVRCTSCGMRMHLRGHRRGYEYHSCQRRCSAGHCPAPTFIAATRLEMRVEDVVLDLLSRRRRPPDSAVHAAEDTGKVAQRRPAAYRDSDRVLATLGDDAYAAGLAARVQRVREASLTLADERTRRGLHEPPATAAIESAWPAMDIAERREIIRRVIDRVFVQPGQSLPPARPRPPRLGRGPARRPAQPVKLDVPDREQHPSCGRHRRQLAEQRRLGTQRDRT